MGNINRTVPFNRDEYFHVPSLTLRITFVTPVFSNGNANVHGLSLACEQHVLMSEGEFSLTEE